MSQVEWLEKELAQKSKQLDAAMRVLHEVTSNDVKRKADAFSTIVGSAEAPQARSA